MIYFDHEKTCVKPVSELWFRRFLRCKASILSDARGYTPILTHDYIIKTWGFQGKRNNSIAKFEYIKQRSHRIQSTLWIDMDFTIVSNDNRRPIRCRSFDFQINEIQFVSTVSK